MLFSAQDLRGGGRQGGSQFQYAMIAQDIDELRRWALALEDKLRTTPGIADVTSDQDRAGPQVNVVIDRDAAARLGVNTIAIDNALNNAYSQRQVSTIYTRAQPVQGGAGDRSEAADRSVAARPHLCRQRRAASRCRCPRSRISSAAPRRWRCGIRASSLPRRSASTCTAGVALGDAEKAVEKAARELRMPDDVRTEFAGNARWLQQSLATQPLLIAAALISIYIVLGVLYESLLHPLTIISTLPSAGLGALLALLITGTDLSIMGMIGIILLMGIVKKNAIMLVDFALEAERQRGLSPARGDPRGLPGALPPDHDDDAGGAVRRAAAGAGVRHRRGAAAAAGHFDHRRADRVADADAVHDARWCTWRWSGWPASGRRLWCRRSDDAGMMCPDSAVAGEE